MHAIMPRWTGDLAHGKEVHNFEKDDKVMPNLGEEFMIRLLKKEKLFPGGNDLGVSRSKGKWERLGHDGKDVLFMHVTSVVLRLFGNGNWR